MKKILILTIALYLTACASLQSPKDTGVAVSTLLEQVQIAINGIDAGTKGSSLPPFQSAEITLSTSAGKSDEGKAAIVLSGGGSKSKSSSSKMVLVLSPNDKKIKPNNVVETSGQKIAEYVIAAIKAVDENKHLTLKTLNVESGFEVKSTKEGGVEITLVGIEIEGKRASESKAAHNLKLTFSHPK